MPHKKVRLSYKKERCLLSDVLPYEIPISFSNRHFYAFVLRYRVTVEENSILWLKGEAVLDNIVSLLLALPENENRLTTVKRFVGEKEVEFRRYCLTGKSEPKPKRFMTPFSFKVKHKESEFRELCVPHPKSQLLVVDFYDRCKEAILYYTSLSEFTIRAPSRIAKIEYHKDTLHFEKRTKESTIIEQSGKEYESLKSFFVYKDYSNIYKFYESYRYHRAEKKYNKLMKLDISKCFDSIYTHSIGWAVIGKDIQKEFLGQSNRTFSGRFDKLMCLMNQGETNGIIIGPEFSRIFSEIILQAIDRDVSRNLEKGDKLLQNRVHYEIFRYVDDYFIFVNDDSDRILIVNELQHALKQYKLYLNTAKAAVYEKPIITEITMAKQQISRLLEDRIKLSLEKTENDNGEILTNGSIYIRSDSLITSFKTIIKTCNVEYGDILNYTLSIVERKCEQVLKNYQEVSEEYKYQVQLVHAINGVLEFVFFIYSVSPRVNTTIRLCRILRVIILLLKSSVLMKDQVQRVHKQIFDNVCFILNKNRSSNQTQVETLYLLTALSELGRDYWLEEDVLANYLGIKGALDGKQTGPIKSLNYFSITVALLYMKDKFRYDSLRSFIIDIAIDRLGKQSETCDKEAEMVFLLFDLISCPYVSEDKKKEALKKFGVTDTALAEEIIMFPDGGGNTQLWFTNWLGFDFGKELDAKRSQEVY